MVSVATDTDSAAGGHKLKRSSDYHKLFKMISHYREVLNTRCEPPKNCSTPTYSSNQLYYRDL